MPSTIFDQHLRDLTIFPPISSIFSPLSVPGLLLTLSTHLSHLPLQWKTAVIHPVPKVPKPTSPVDWPISVVAILSRIIEHFIVHSYFYPALQSTPLAKDIKDQFAFRPMGSTTTAVIDLLQQTSTMLESNEYVLIISLDFSKAFDMVSHTDPDAKCWCS